VAPGGVGALPARSPPDGGKGLGLLKKLM